MLAVWFICAVAFGLFNALYWPLQNWQAWNAEANYLLRVEAALEAGDPVEARQMLKRGIERFHPLSEAAWRHYADLSEGPAAVRAGSTAQWYAALEHTHLPHPESLFPGGTPPRLALLDFTAHATPILTLEEALLQATGIAPDDAWSLAQRLALLEAAQGRVALGGVIGRTGIKTPVSLLVQSGGGTGTQRCAHIFVDGIDYASERRGFHATILAPDIGAVLQSGRFDLWEHPQEAHRMLRFLEDAPIGSIGLFAVYDDASVNLHRPLEEALLDFGLQREAWIEGRLRLFGIRYSFAAIGVKGSAPGTALQAWTPHTYQGRAGHPVAVVVLTEEEASS